MKTIIRNLITPLIVIFAGEVADSVKAQTQSKAQKLFTFMKKNCSRSMLRLFLLMVALSAQNLSAQECADLRDTWTVTESVTLTITINGDPDTTTTTGNDTVVMTQDGCTPRFFRSIPLPTGGTFQAERVGTIDGNTVTFTGIAAIPVEGVTCSKNSFVAIGMIDGSRIDATTSVDVHCTVPGIVQTVTGNGTAVFIGTPTNFTLQGEVRQDTANGSPLGGVLVQLTGGATLNTHTDASGRFRFDNLSSGNYGVWPAKSGFLFEPASQQVSLGQNLEMTPFVAIYDTDGDGIGDNVDTDDDNDGLPDTFEMTNGLDSLNALDAALDNDSDGLTNLEEFLLGTNINNPDTDGDGIADNIDENPLVFDDLALRIPSGRLYTLPDIDADGITEIGILRVDANLSQVRLEILHGKDKTSLDEIVWVDNFVDATLSLHLIPDMNNNGFHEVGLFGIQDIVNNEGKPQMFVRDLKTGNKVGNVYNWVANWTEVSALVLEDMTGDGLAEIAIQGRFFDGNRPQLVVKIGNTNTILDAYSYPDLFVSPQYYQHSDMDGDGFKEIATFGRLIRNNKIQTKIASGIDAGTKMKAYNFPDKWDNVSWHRLDDSNEDGQDDWGMFGTLREDGRPQLVNKNGVSATGVLRIFAWPAAMENAQFFRVPDMNNDGVDEVAAAGRRSNNGRYQFQVQNGTDRNDVLANHNLNLNLESVTYHVLPDLSGDEKAEIGFMGINPQGEYELVIQHGDIVTGEFANFNLGSDWQSTPAITSLGDTDDNGLPDILIYGQNATAEQLVIISLDTKIDSIPDAAGTSLFGYGDNRSGQLGNGTLINPPGIVSIDVNVNKISAGGEHSLYLTSDASLWGMGENGNGQLGDGTLIDRPTPILIDTDVAKISAGFWHSLYVKTDGSLWGMGDNKRGELGTFTLSNILTPILIDTEVVEVSAGTNHFGTHSLYVKSNGTLMAMGANGSGRLGDGTTKSRYDPVQIDSNVSVVSAANFHSLYLKKDGKMYAMGWNDFGQLGDGTSVSRSVPILVDTSVSIISGGNNKSYYIKTNGDLMGMGSNINGPLAGSLTPVLKDTNVINLSAGMQANGVYVKGTGALYNLADGSLAADGVGSASAGGYHVLYIN